MLRTDQVPGLVEALSGVAERIDRMWAVDGAEYAEQVVLRSPDPDDPEVIQRVADNLPEVISLLIQASSTDEALDTIGALLGVDEVEVMVGLARFDLRTLTRPATEARLRALFRIHRLMR